MTSAKERLPDRLVLFWDHRLVQLLGGSPLGAAAIVATAMFASFYALAVFSGIYDMIDAGNVPELALTFGLDPYTWAAFVTSLMTGFSISAATYAVINEDQDLREAAVVLGREPEGFVDQWLTFQKAGVVRGRFVGLLLYFVGLVVVLLNIPGAADVVGVQRGQALPWFQQVPGAWFLLFVPVNFAIIGKGAYFTISEERYQKKLRVRHLKIDLFHQELLKPFNRMALRRCLLWSIGSSVGLLFFLNDAIDTGGLAPFLLGIFFVALAALVVPLSDIHKKIVATKRDEIGDVRAHIVRLKTELLGSDGGTGDVAQRLTGLIAYEARLEKVPEWPIDLPTIGKFSLYMGIPVFSWVGGALVERVVDSLF